MKKPPPDVIAPAEAGSLAGLFRERVARSPDACAYLQYTGADEGWQAYSWGDTGREVARWQAALLREGLAPGDRVAIWLRNCRDWVLLDQAALGCGLVVVPLYTDDRPDNVAYVLQDAGVKLLLLQGEAHWDRLQSVHHQLKGLRRILSIDPVGTPPPDPRLRTVGEWLPDEADGLLNHEQGGDSLATIVYTSGTTGRPKGVMLSHHNILHNAFAAQGNFFSPADRFLSFLPLSHMFERTAGYYLPMMVGASVAYARSVPQLAEDLQQIRPTILVSVPRIFERVYGKIHAQLAHKSAFAQGLFRLAVASGWHNFEYQQGRARWSPRLMLWPLLERLVAGKIQEKLGGRMRLAVSGGAPLAHEVAQLFIGLGIPIYQGYGMTECSPVVSTNVPENNDPDTVGAPLDGVEVRIGSQDELLVKGHCVMLGYWNNPEATATLFDEQGWLRTGDKASMKHGRIRITGRLKDILVLANGEKVPPADMELAVSLDPLFEQVMIIGDNRPFLSALVVLDMVYWQGLAAELGMKVDSLGSHRLNQIALERIARCLHAFPGYARVRRVACLGEAWTVENGLITPTLKLKRDRILEHHSAVVDSLYSGHR